MSYIIALLLYVTSAWVHAAEVPQDSIYQFNAQWQTAAGETISLSHLQGKKQIIAMFYSHCSTACPVIVADMQKIERALTASQKENVGFVLVSLDPDRDTAESLAAFAKKRGLNDNWQLLHGSSEDVRGLSMLLNVRYQDIAGGEIAHSKLLHVVDEQGRIVLQTATVEDESGLIEKMGL